jgi:LexA-binding, inner membrane-associated putative hydrolase
MFVAHLPAGYLVGAATAGRWPVAHFRNAWCAVLLGSIAPDLDLFYYYLVSDRSINHHVYPTHVPIVWLMVSFTVAFCLWRAPPRWRIVWALFCTGWLLHLVLDTVAGHIWWLWPWVTTPYVLIEVPRRFDLWWLNFLTHPSILLELVITGCAVALWCRRAKLVKKRANFSVQVPQRPYRTFL